MSEWCTIESDPGLFTELIQEMGVKNVQVEEIYNLSDENFLDSIQPIYGLIFLFKWSNKLERKECLSVYDSDLFFANQVISNACATQAILSILLNCEDLELGEELNSFKKFTKDLDSQMKGLSLSNSDSIKKIHNSFAKPEPFVYTQSKKPAKDGDDVYHFISYVPFKKCLYELDGLQSGPVFLGKIEKENEWVELAKQEINQRIKKYSESEIRFNLLAIVHSKKQIIQAKLLHLKKDKICVLKYCIDNKFAIEENEKKNYENLLKEIKNEEIKSSLVIPEKFEEILPILMNLNNEIEKNSMLLLEENEKINFYKEENIRRKHNYIPFILELLKLTAKKGKLEDLVAEAKKKKDEKKKEKEKKLEKDKMDKEKEKSNENKMNLEK